MARSTLERFQRRLSLVAYFRYVFGVEDGHDQQSMRRFYDFLKDREGYDAEGRSYVYGILRNRVRGIDEAKLLDYDANVRRHTDALNQSHRDHQTGRGEDRRWQERQGFTP